MPRSEGGRETAPLHPICHRAIHRHIPNRDLARSYASAEALRAHEGVARFLKWIAGKPPDFHAPTFGRRKF